MQEIIRTFFFFFLPPPHSAAAVVAAASSVRHQRPLPPGVFLQPRGSVAHDRARLRRQRAGDSGSIGEKGVARLVG